MISSSLHFPLELTGRQREQLASTFSYWDQFYDDQEHLLCTPISGPSYHTNIREGMVHHTRESLAYAVSLLDSGEPDRIAKALATIERVIGLQDIDLDSETYGIWSWYLEEPLEKMSPPDWNWADFCGAQLLEAILTHRAILPTSLAAKVDEALLHAARSIKRRNMGCHYTNIVIMGNYVAWMVGQIHGDDELLDFARDRMKRFHEYTFHHGAFTEFNSSTYTLVTLTEIARMRRFIQDETMLGWANDCYRLAWEEIAGHYHSPTKQWAGPQSRCYQTLLPKNNWLEYILSDGQADPPYVQGKPQITPQRYYHECPADLRHHFDALEAPRTLYSTFFRGEPGWKGFTYLTPEFALGSVNISDMFNQRRPMLGYWGSAEAPASLVVRQLHDDYDFSSAFFHSSQTEGRLLGAINFATDWGDRALMLTPIIDETIEAHRMSVRFEFRGALPESMPECPENLSTPLEIHCDEVSIRICAPLAFWDGKPAYWRKGADEDSVFYDLIFYEGDNRAFKLPDLKASIAAFTVEYLSLIHI